MIEESERIKNQIINECKDQLKGVLSDDELKKFEIAFWSATDRYLFKKKEPIGHT